MSDSLLRKPLTGLLLLTGAAGGPYVWYETDVGNQIWQSATNGIQTVQEENSAFDSTDLRVTNSLNRSFAASGATGNPILGQPNQQIKPDPFNPDIQSLGQVPVVSLAEILRFDITPEWVMARFPRVTTLLSEMNLDGLRTPLITGSTPSDMAGTLTYYFDRYKRMKRVSIHATLGDPTRHIMELQQAYQMSQEPSLGGSLYVIKWNGTPTSVLHVSPASVIYSDLSYGRYNLFLELNQADLEYGLSPEARQLVEAGRNTNRW